MAKQEVNRTKPTKAKIKTWLKAKGLRATDVDREVDGKSERDAILALHNVKLAEWKVAGGQ